MGFVVTTSLLLLNIQVVLTTSLLLLNTHIQVVVTTSLLLLNIQGAAARVLQYLWVPFAVLGVAYAVWRYYTRLSMLQVRECLTLSSISIDLSIYRSIYLSIYRSIF